MIVLDTNVLSETLRPAPDARALFTTTITRGELLYGARLLPDGQCKAALLEAIRAIFVSDLAGQVLGFDDDAADA